MKNVSKILFITYLVYFLLMTALFTLLANYDDEIYDAIGNHSLGKVGLPARELHGSAFLLLVSLTASKKKERNLEKKHRRRAINPLERLSRCPLCVRS